MQDYKDEETPLDAFDDECHGNSESKEGIIANKMTMSDSDIMYMVNVSEQVQRPKDMLMFLGEYFKAVIQKTDKINNDNKDAAKLGSKF
jgi:hypothetical protein